jgi:peroxiredoxin Q/BCP
VLGVSADSLETHAEFSRKHNITFPLIADEDGALRRDYGRGRVTFLIDRHGMVRYVKTGVPRNEDFLREIRKINEEQRSAAGKSG